LDLLIRAILGSHRIDLSIDSLANKAAHSDASTTSFSEASQIMLQAMIL